MPTGAAGFPFPNPLSIPFAGPGMLVSTARGGIGFPVPKAVGGAAVPVPRGGDGGVIARGLGAGAEAEPVRAFGSACGAESIPSKGRVRLASC